MSIQPLGLGWFRLLQPVPMKVVRWREHPNPPSSGKVQVSIVWQEVPGNFWEVRCWTEYLKTCIIYIYIYTNPHYRLHHTVWWYHSTSWCITICTCTIVFNKSQDLAIVVINDWQQLVFVWTPTNKISSYKMIWTNMILMILSFFQSNHTWFVAKPNKNMSTFLVLNTCQPLSFHQALVGRTHRLPSMIPL